MFEFRYNIHYGPESKMPKPGGRSRHSGEQQSAMYAMLFEERQLLNLEQEEHEYEVNADDMDLEKHRRLEVGNTKWILIDARATQTRTASTGP